MHTPLKKSTQNNKVINVSDIDLPKSYVITNENGEKKVYISPISAQTLYKRSENKDFIKNLHF